MDQRSVRVVVGQGDPARHALRDVLVSDGFDVVGEVTAAADLAQVLAAERPDVVVLDDAIGVNAAQIVSQVAPNAKLVVIWPAGVVPISGAARVDPAEVTTALSATVGLAAGVELSGLSTIDRPDWIDKVRKDPATLREKLATGGSVPVRPSVTELQRRGQRLHPSTGMGRRRSARATGDGPGAAEVLLPIAAVTQVAEPRSPTAGPPSDEGEADATLDRRIGMIALGGAAVAGALMIALSFGAHRQPSVIAAEPFLPPVVSGSLSGPPPSTPVGTPTPSHTTTPPPTGPKSTTGGSGVTTVGVSSGPTPGPAGSGGAGGPSSGGSGSGAGGSGSSGPGTARPSSATAGASASHNPHDGAPGLLRLGGATTAHAGGHTPHGAHPIHPVHPHKQ